MNRFFDEFAETRAKNMSALTAFGVNAEVELDEKFRTVRSGTDTTLFTIGYEKRDGEEFISILLDAGVEVLADVRQRAFSRKPDFRKKALQALCDEAGIEYQLWPELGSTDDLRDELRESGNFDQFARSFRKLATKNMKEPLARLAEEVRSRPVAFMCYERRHEECHRSVLADLIAKQIDASVIAL